MNLNQLTIIGFIGKNAETKQLPNGAMITKFSVATTKSWKDDSGDWKSKTQWHNVIAFGQSYAQMAVRLLKGSLVFVQGELITREYDRTIQVPTGKKTCKITPEAQAVIGRVASYTEISPSGTGIHILVKAKLHGPGRRTGKLELYDSGRYFTITGQHLSSSSVRVENRQSQVEKLFCEIFTSEMITR